jgi:hypothetical protein
MRLESGPAKTDAFWQLGRANLFLAFAGYFIYDGAAGYPNRNRTAAEQVLQTRPFSGQVKFGSLTEVPDRVDYDKLRRAHPTNVSLEQVHQAFGKPAFADKSAEYFISRFGYVQVPLPTPGNDAKTSDMVWKPWAKTKDEVQAQFYWAIVPFVPGLYFLWRLLKAATLRVTIDDDGMSYGGLRIAFADMVSLRDYSPKGWIDLYYKVAGAGEERKLRLDNEKVLLFDEIVAAICDAKHFQNEVLAYAEQKARDKTEGEPATDEPADPEGPDDTAKG